MHIINITPDGVKAVKARLAKNTNLGYIVSHGNPSLDGAEYRLRLSDADFPIDVLVPEIQLEDDYQLVSGKDHNGQQMDYLSKKAVPDLGHKSWLTLFSLEPPHDGFSTILAIGSCCQIASPRDEHTGHPIVTLAPVLYVYGPCKITCRQFQSDESKGAEWSAEYNGSSWTIMHPVPLI